MRRIQDSCKHVRERDLQIMASDFYLVIIVAKHSILYVCERSVYTSEEVPFGEVLLIWCKIFRKSVTWKHLKWVFIFLFFQNYKIRLFERSSLYCSSVIYLFIYLFFLLSQSSRFFETSNNSWIKVIF